jgi:SAM-dependent methyltransferase
MTAPSAPSRSTSRGTRAGWPFWAPSDDDGAARALDLAGVQAGDRVADLGCGDGRVLVAAARRGAEVLGIESDADLAELSRKSLAAEGLRGTVVRGDLFEVELDVDVAFCYLAPATLQRLVPRLRHGTRLVTVDFEVPGLVPDAVDGPARLYRLPGIPIPRAGRREIRAWPSAGTLAVAPPDVESLTCLEVRHRGGDVEVTVGPTLSGVVSIATGADRAHGAQVVAVDVVWSPAAAGAAHVGTLRCHGVEPHALIAVREDWSPQGNHWELTADGAAAIAAHIATHHRPHTLASLLDAAEG